jgi:hypothetical protein
MVEGKVLTAERQRLWTPTGQRRDNTLASLTAELQFLVVIDLAEIHAEHEAVAPNI